MIGINRNNLNYGVASLVVALTLLLVFPEWWNSLLAVNGFIPHGHCYLWKPGLVWLHVISDSLIALAYVAISGTLAYLVYKTRQEIPFQWMFLAFGSFIVACGSTHFMDVWTLWHPTYWLSGALKVVTAIASVTTASILPFLVPQALALVESAKLSEERRSHLEIANHRLEALNEQLKEVDQLKTQFFANVSHELRTPLALILGPVEKLLNNRDLSQDHHRDLEIVDRNARLLLKQVNDLLDVSKLEAGRITVNYAQVDLAQLVRLTAANFDGLAQEKSITLTIDAPASLSAQIDAAKVQRILLNLISNAFKFTPNGGTIRCALETAQAETTSTDDVSTSSQTQSDRVILSVQDSGPGVPIELREAIFERFSQGEGGTTRRFGGTGLGLAIAKEFVELQGGTIGVSDAPEGGAQFTVELPLMAPPSAVVTTPAVALEQREDVASLMVEELRTVRQVDYPQQEQATGKPLVLVVEDNPEMNQFITTTLTTEYRTATAANGQEGLEQAISLQPDLILSDVMMPYLSGPQLVQQLRTHPELDTTPVIMLTAKADDELRVQLLRQGAQDYLMKPFSVEELKARVGNLIAIKRVRDLLQQELASQNQDLEALVEEVSLRRRELQIALNALQRQAEELEQANRLKDEFLAIVSHELRTPLNSILGWAEALRTRQFNERITARALETIQRNARLQTQLIENLLDISRLLRGKLLLNKHPVDLKPVIETAIQTVQPEADAKSIQLDSYLDDTVGQVSGDGDRLRQVVENLLSNAVKFTPECGQVEIRLEQQNAEARIQVSDTGQGIRADVLPHIFDYFRQADSSNTRKHGGLGLGLAIVRQLVELHGGDIQVESQGEGQGATFMVVLPLITTSTPPLYLR
ncbi:MAG TPA: histidine kinase [Cyanobacteria bacterium UBA8803]|nr:histidine kinase [Cyanobacteria bacterium UBA9273]HBL62085.1 histidine kinase [Cyanobacteria bacterium UBA8803]